jgi:hypothetical protein
MSVGIFYYRLGKFSGHLAYSMAIWYIFPPFGILLPLLGCCAKKNLATLLCPCINSFALKANNHE